MNVSGVNGRGATEGSPDVSALEAQLKVLQNGLKNLQKRAAKGEDVAKEIQSQNAKIEQVKQKIAQAKQKFSGEGKGNVEETKKDSKTKQVKELSRALKNGDDEVEEGEKTTVTAFQNRRKVTDPNRLLDEYA